MTSPMNGLWRAIDGLGTDVRLSVRSLARTRGFTLVALLSLALGIGANAALFSVVHAAFIRPVPGVAEPDRVVEMLMTSRGRTMTEWSYPDLEDVRAAGTPVQTVAGWKMRDGALVVGDASQRVRAMYASSGYFTVLRVRPALGRPFQASEDIGAGQHPVAVVSHKLWQTVLGGRADIVGTVITLDRTPYTVVGVAPETFRHHRVGEPARSLGAARAASDLCGARELRGRSQRVLGGGDRPAPAGRDRRRGERGGGDGVRRAGKGVPGHQP